MAQHGLTGKIGPRVVIYEVGAVRADTYRVIAIFGREQLEMAAVKVSSVEMSKIRILACLTSAGHKIDHLGLGIDTLDATDHPGSLGQLFLKPSRPPVVKVDVIPAV